jgi:hypothetical protein
MSRRFFVELGLHLV